MRSALIVFLCAGAFAATPEKLPLPTAPMLFEQTSQQPGRKQWTARGLGYAFRFEKTGTAMRLGDRTLRMTFENSNASAPFTGLDHTPYPTNYFHGRTYERIENYTRLRRSAVYPGIDVVYSSRNGEFEYDFEIAPGADPSQIALRFEGADSVRVNDHGDLILSLAGKELIQRVPSIYQKRGSGEFVTVAAAYVPGDDGSFHFHVGAHPRTAPLVIAPSIVYVAFIGGSFGDVGMSVGHDAQGFIYIGGNTFSTDFPTGGVGFSQTAFGQQDCFLIKINPSSTNATETIAYSTYYGGTGDDMLTAMKVNETGQIFFTGNTASTNFPVSTGAFSNTLAVGTHAFFVELDSNQNSTTSQLYSSYLGGTIDTGGNPSSDSGQGLSVGANGMVYVTGYTTSTDFPVNGASQGVIGGSYDAFIAEFDPTQGGPNSLLFSTFLGGAAQDWGNDIGVDSKGLVYVTGYTFSSDFPFTSSTAYESYQGEGDAFLTIINTGSGEVTYSTFLGGAHGFDEGNRLLVDPTGTTVAIAGYTLSPQFPVTQNAYQSVMPALTNVDDAGNQLGSNGFLAVFNMKEATARFKGVTYATYFGGFGGEVIYGLRSDTAGNYYICGYTLSQNLPVTSTAFNTASAGGGLDGFVTILNPSGATPSSQLVFSTYITSPGTQTVYDIDVDDKGAVWFTGVATAGIFPPGYEQFPSSPSSIPGYPPLSQLGKQESFIWGFTIQ
ncbi:MAG: SBBP repeat-containing protein [Bryobacteraceae bacterium]